MCWVWDYSWSNQYDYNGNDCINVEVSGSKGRKIISDYISALNGDEEAINWAYDRRKAEYDTYDDELKNSIDKCFDCI